MMQFRLTDDLGYNDVLGTEAGQDAAMAQYETIASGPLAMPRCDIVAFVKTRPTRAPRRRAPDRAVSRGTGGVCHS